MNVLYQSLLSEASALEVLIKGSQYLVRCGPHFRVIAAQGRHCDAQSMTGNKLLTVYRTLWIERDRWQHRLTKVNITCDLQEAGSQANVFVGWSKCKGLNLNQVQCTKQNKIKALWACLVRLPGRRMKLNKGRRKQGSYSDDKSRECLPSLDLNMSLLSCRKR